MTRFQQAVLWLLVALALIVASLLVNAEVTRKDVAVKCVEGVCMIAEKDLAGLVGAAEHLYREVTRLKSGCGDRQT